MIIIRFDGGLGNQMLAYAFYRWLKEYRNDVKADVYCYGQRPFYRSGNNAHNGYELDRIFGLRLDVATRKEVWRLAGCGGKIGKWTTKVMDIIGMLNIIKLEADGLAGIYNKKFVESVIQASDAYISAFCHSEKYFSSIEGNIRRDFTFSKLIDENNIEVAREINSTNSVSIHVRRGDYLTWGENGLRCDVRYYQRAIEYIKDRVTNPFFFVFSNDMDWCKKNIIADNVRFVDNNTGDKAYIDMQLMSLCRHNIIANSTFSWWGAWLNNNSKKIVVAPDVWYGEINSACDNVVPTDWVRIRTGK